MTARWWHPSSGIEEAVRRAAMPAPDRVDTKPVRAVITPYPVRATVGFTRILAAGKATQLDCGRVGMLHDPLNGSPRAGPAGASLPRFDPPGAAGA